MDAYLDPLAIVQSGPPQESVLEHEAQRLDQVQTCTRIGTQPHEVACIGGDLGFVEDDVKHLSGARFGVKFREVNLEKSVLRLRIKGLSGTKSNNFV